MPAFTFEKLSSPAAHEPAAPAAEKHRGPLGQLVDRLVENRARRKKPSAAPSDGRHTKPAK